MKKFILLFASVASLFSGCSEYIVGYDASTIEHLCRINYTSLTKIDVDLFCCDAELIGHTWKYGVGTLYFNEDITMVRDFAFHNCSSLTSITIPDSVTSIGKGAFSNCSSLTSVTIPDSVTSIGGSAFDGCTSLTSVTIPDGVTSIGDYAFRNCNSLRRVYITDIAAWCNISFGSFDSNPLYYAGNLYLNNELVTDLIIPDSATKIGRCAFYGYDLLTSVTIPDSVISIGYEAFGECYSLKEVYCKPTTPPAGGSSMFNGNASGRKIYVPSNSVSAYKSASGWSEYNSYIVGYDF